MKVLHRKNQEQLNFYDHRIPDYLEYAKNVPYARYMVNTVLDEMIPPRKKILEVGAGQGRFTFELAKFVGNITATDISRTEIEILRGQIKKRKIRSITASVQDLLQIGKTLKPQKFDHIVGFFILHHLPKDELSSVVRQLIRYMKPGARMSFVENNNLSPMHLLAIMLRPEMTWEVEKGTYTNYIGCFKKACKINGLRIITSRKLGFLPPEIINRMPGAVIIDRIIAKLPLISEFLCPFILLSAEKS